MTSIPKDLRHGGEPHAWMSRGPSQSPSHPSTGWPLIDPVGSMGRSSHGRTKGPDARASIELPRPCSDRRDALATGTRALLGPAHLAVRDEACDPTVHVRSLLPSHLRHSDPHPQRRSSLSSSIEGRFGGKRSPLPGRSASPAPGASCMDSNPRALPLGGASPLAPSKPLRARWERRLRRVAPLLLRGAAPPLTLEPPREGQPAGSRLRQGVGAPSDSLCFG